MVQNPEGWTVVGLYFTWSPLGLIVIITRLSRELQKIISIHIQRNFRGVGRGVSKVTLLEYGLKGLISRELLVHYSTRGMERQPDEALLSFCVLTPSTSKHRGRQILFKVLYLHYMYLAQQSCFISSIRAKSIYLVEWFSIGYKAPLRGVRAEE